MNRSLNKKTREKEMSHGDIVTCWGSCGL